VFKVVRLRQILDQTRHRILFVPMLFVAGSIGFSQLILWIDRQLADDDLPKYFETTVGSGRLILSAIAGGLISSITLLLSLMLVAVQLTNSQFSPRTLRYWIGDKTQQITIGIVLGTTVYCLLILKETRTFGENEELAPHLSVLLALIAGVLSLVAVVRSVDHMADGLRVGSVANNISTQTTKLIEQNNRLSPIESPAIAPVPKADSSEAVISVPDSATPVISSESGWVQQIDEDAILSLIEQGSTAYFSVALGDFVLPESAIMWVWPSPDEECITKIRSSVALGDTRTMQQDIGFGILQLVDIALRALSPGINDPNTANDIIVHLSVIMLALWERPIAPAHRVENSRTIVRSDLTHGEYLHAAFDQIRRYGAGDCEVAATMVKVLKSLSNETSRRNLPGPQDPITDIIEQILEQVDNSNFLAHDKIFIQNLWNSDDRR